MAVHSIEKTRLSAKEMLLKVRSVFNQIPNKDRDARGLKAKITLSDCLMSGLAVFGLKFPSLLQFDEERQDEIIQHNLSTLYNITNIPSDTYIRERLD